jgi:multiple sugar transport system substrate-binding protein
LWSAWLALAIVLGLSLAGCNTVKSAASESVKLRYSDPLGAAEIAPILADFEEQYPWITVEVVEQPRSENEFMNQIAAGIDLVRLERGLGMAMMQQNLIRPLDDVQLTDWAAIRDDYYPAVWDSLRIEGQQWAIPATVNPLVTFVNLDRTQSAGVELPTERWTMFALLNVASRLHTPTITAEGQGSLFGLCTAPDSVDPIVLIYLQGGRIVDNLYTPTRATLDEPATIEAVEWYTDLFARYNIASTVQTEGRAMTEEELSVPLGTGACGMWFGWYDDRGGLQATNRSNQFGPRSRRWSYDWAMLPLPEGNAGAMAVAEVDCYWVPQGALHPEEALLLARYLSDRWETAGYQLPARRSLAESTAYRQSAGEAATAIIDQMPEQLLVMPSENDPTLASAAAATLQSMVSIINDNLDPTAVLRKAQDDLDARAAQ